ncbi:MAG: hypothetical protein JJ939_02655 [Alphaproteobacteria bacterium]|nr:hypothetical protein [Alphaproteobacteria bacterium]MBO6627303.1 hypothetical protein [Alphaproteobacteria bacterium]MDF1626518.1 hypothetical protein [Parvibaculaceae bacterium]
MELELKGEAIWAFAHARVIAVVAALVLFLLHRLGVDPADDVLEWLVIVLPALELSVLTGLAALVVDGDLGEGRLSRFFAALRWFGFVVMANWVLALFIQASLAAYVRLGGPAVYLVPM